MVGVNTGEGDVVLSKVILIKSSMIFSFDGVVRGAVRFCGGVNGQEHNQLAFLSCGLVLLQHVSVVHGDPLVVGLPSASGRFEFLAPFDGFFLVVSGLMICGRPPLESTHIGCADGQGQSTSNSEVGAPAANLAYLHSSFDVVQSGSIAKSWNVPNSSLSNSSVAPFMASSS
ncbi:hypothetical protein Nepgr_007947 [Nepenthes gracilis]|uniref:Uncharacterized protein n=1 Tax=Nepenthes gracilis TaxID=150966 RepID=A0AAD3S8P2_NEPGR|nr:hypothetical protein Nepgr_007947 [Nepenthes gracilis]